jgi:hypothetical protein
LAGYAQKNPKRENHWKSKTLSYGSIAVIPPGCTRVTIDLPTELVDRIRRLSEAPPDSISCSEWMRRVIAYHAKFHLPSAKERARTRARLDGNRKRSAAPFPRPPDTPTPTPTDPTLTNTAMPEPPTEQKAFRMPLPSQTKKTATATATAKMAMDDG